MLDMATALSRSLIRPVIDPALMAFVGAATTSTCWS
jgi:hypothetical protein